MPQRIQRKRVKGWRMPAGAVSVTRPGKWGNPFKLEPGADYRSTREGCVGAFEDWIKGRAFIEDCQEQRKRMLADLHELRGKDLACFCPLDGPCHADVLIMLANSPEG